MQLLRRIQVTCLALMMGATVVIDLAGPAASLPTQDTFTTRRTRTTRTTRRRLRFRVGVRPSRYRVGGFSRSASCGTSTLTALVPPPQAQEKVTDKHGVIDKTSSARPTLLINLPELPPTIGQFTLQDEAGKKDLYNFTFQLSGKPGIVGIPLPTSGPTLEVGHKYLWQVAIACTPEAEDDKIIVSSWIERVASPANTGPDPVAALAEQGIWQDAVSFLAQQRLQKPNDKEIAEDWASLMEDAGLPQFKQTAVVQFVKN